MKIFCPPFPVCDINRTAAEWSARFRKPGAEVRQTLNNFMHASDNLDWDGFRLSFADDATVFYPREYPYRAAGRQKFEAFFQKVFDRIRT